jgi:serine/threonine protein kinase
VEGSLRFCPATRQRQAKKSFKLAASSIFAHMTAVSGLAYLHNENVIHNDIKEANVLVAQEGGKKVLKFTDFGARACPSLSWPLTCMFPHPRITRFMI